MKGASKKGSARQRDGFGRSVGTVIARSKTPRRREHNTRRVRESTYPSGPLNRGGAGNYLMTGQVPGTSAVHMASDIPVSAYGLGASLFTGVMDNTDVFFEAAQIAQTV